MFVFVLRCGCLRKLICAVLPQVTRDYDEEEQGYDSEKEREDKKTVESDDSGSSPVHAKGNGVSREANHNGDEHHGDEDDMEVSD